MIRRWLIRIVAAASITVCAAIVLSDTMRGWPNGGGQVLIVSLNVVISLVFTGVGWLISERRPSNVIGPLLLIVGAMYAWFLPADFYLTLPEVFFHRVGTRQAAEFAALFVHMIEVPLYTILALALVLFPDGRLPTPRWRWIVWAAAIGIGLVVAGFVLYDGPLPIYPDYHGPYGIAGFPGLELVRVAYAVMVGVLIAGVVGLVIRWRRDDRVEQAQIKWVVAATLVMGATNIVGLANSGPASEQTIVLSIATSIGWLLVPTTIGIAILRYRLYEIDRIVSRTVSWAVVSGILGAVFVGGVVALQAALAGFTQGETLAVAGSTLASFALFQPVRRRVQTTVDRRFDRARYDAQRTVDAFAEAVRNEVDLVRLRMALVATSEDAVRPVGATVWLREPAPNGSRPTTA